MYPLDDIKVTFELSFSAAKQLRDLAVSGDDRLKSVGIVKVKINNGSEISLMDNDKFKRPTLPVFPPRKDLKGRQGRSLTSRRVLGTANKGTRPSGRPSNSKAASKERQKNLTFGRENETQCNRASLHESRSDARPSAVSNDPTLSHGMLCDKKRVVRISQGTATDDARQRCVAVEGDFLKLSEKLKCLDENGLENIRPIDHAELTAGVVSPHVINRTVKDVMKTEGGECVVHAVKTSVPVRKQSTSSQTTSMELMSTVEEIDCSKDERPTYESELVRYSHQGAKCDNQGQLSCMDIVSTGKVFSSSVVKDPVPISSVSPGKDMMPLQCSKPERIAKCQSRGLTCSNEPLGGRETTTKDTSNHNFAALQMLSDICFSETNIASQTGSPDAACSAMAGQRTVSCQTELVPPEGDVVTENVKITFVDERQIGIKVLDMSAAFRLAAAKHRSSLRKASTPPAPPSLDCELSNPNNERRPVRKLMDSDICDCLTGNYHTCFRSKRPRRHSFSSSSSHVMVLRSRKSSSDSVDDLELSDVELNEKGLKTEFDVEGECSVKDRATEPVNCCGISVSSQPKYDPNNNAVAPQRMDFAACKPTLAINSGSDGHCLSLRPLICNAQRDAGCDNLDAGSSPLAMLQGTVSKIPTPDVPACRRHQSSPKNIVSEYTEIIIAKIEGVGGMDETVTEAPSTEESHLSQLDFIATPPLLLYKEQGLLTSTDFVKSILPDTPPLLSETAAVVNTCFPNRNCVMDDSTADIVDEYLSELVGTKPPPPTDDSPVTTEAPLPTDLFPPCVENTSPVVGLKNGEISSQLRVEACDAKSICKSGDKADSQLSEIPSSCFTCEEKESFFENPTQSAVNTETAFANSSDPKPITESEASEKGLMRENTNLTKLDQAKTVTLAQVSIVEGNVPVKADDSCEIKMTESLNMNTHYYTGYHLEENIVGDNMLIPAEDSVRDQGNSQPTDLAHAVGEQCIEVNNSADVSEEEDEGGNSEEYDNSTGSTLPTSHEVIDLDENPVVAEDKDQSQFTAAETGLVIEEVEKVYGNPAVSAERHVQSTSEKPESTDQGYDAQQQRDASPESTVPQGENSTKPKKKKRAQDGTHTEDMSYVLKRIQGNDSRVRGGDKILRSTRSRKRLSDGQSRASKKMRYSR